MTWHAIAGAYVSDVIARPLARSQARASGDVISALDSMPHVFSLASRDLDAFRVNDDGAILPILASIAKQPSKAADKSPVPKVPASPLRWCAFTSLPAGLRLAKAVQRSQMTE